MKLHVLVALVLKKPAVNSGRRGSERAVGSILANLVVQFVALKVILGRFLVRFTVEFKRQVAVRFLAVVHTCAFLELIVCLSTAVKRRTRATNSAKLVALASAHLEGASIFGWSWVSILNSPLTFRDNIPRSDTR